MCSSTVGVTIDKQAIIQMTTKAGYSKGLGTVLDLPEKRKKTTMNELGAENGSIKQKGVFVSLFLSHFIFLLFLRYLFVFY